MYVFKSMSLLKVITLLSGSACMQVSAGCGHTSLLTGRGRVFTCGDNRYFQLGKEQQLLMYSCIQNSSMQNLRFVYVYSLVPKLHPIIICISLSNDWVEPGNDASAYTVFP